MAKAKVLENLVLINNENAFRAGEEVYAFWFDSEGSASVESEEDLPKNSEGWTLHIQQIGVNGEKLWSPAEWDFDDISDDAVEVIDSKWQPAWPN